MKLGGSHDSVSHPFSKVFLYIPGILPYALDFFQQYHERVEKFLTPLKMNGWNLKITQLQRKMIFHPPPFLGSRP